MAVPQLPPPPATQIQLAQSEASVEEARRKVREELDKLRGKVRLKKPVSQALRRIGSAARTKLEQATYSEDDLADADAEPARDAG